MQCIDSLVLDSFQLFHCQLETNHNFELNYVIPVCAVSEEVGGWTNGSEGEEEREEVERALEGMKEEKAWASKPPAGEEPLWKLWGLREAEMGTKKAEYIQ